MEPDGDQALWRELVEAMEFEEAAPGWLRPEPGALVAGLRILGPLGEGGMGVVFEAEQQNPRRRVALKIIRPGSSSRRLLQRFELEAKVLARLQHPGIAQVFESGTFESAVGPQPYLVLELVEGTPFLEHAAALDVGRRLRLLIAVAEAVQHAHEKGVVHRDLKPANILVDERGQPKVLDFGVARLTDDDDERTLMTRAGQVVGTLAYMAPEQLGGDPAEVDVRSDVYALGVIAYETLCGVRPHDLGGKSLSEVSRLLAEADPAWLGRVAPPCRGDVSAVVHKALAADKARRYPSAAAFAADLGRVIAKQPVEARRPTAWYQLQRLASRHRAAVAGAVAVVLVLAAGVVATSWQAFRARRAEQAALLQKQQAEEEARGARAARDFLQEILIQASPAEPGGAVLTLDRVVEIAFERLDSALFESPAVEGAVRHTLGRILIGFGRFSEGRDHLLRTVELLQRSTGSSRDQLPWALVHLAEAHLKLGEADEAERCIERALGLSESLPGEGRLLVATAANSLALARFRAGLLDEAEAGFRRAIRAYELAGGEAGAVNAAICRANLAGMLVRSGSVDEGERLFGEVLPELRRRFEGSVVLASALANRARVFEAREEWERARRLLREAHDIQVAARGEASGPAALCAVRLAWVELRAGDSSARARAEAQLAVAARALGDGHPEVQQARLLLDEAR